MNEILENMHELFGNFLTESEEFIEKLKESNNEND